MENITKQAGAEMCQAHIKLRFGLAYFGVTWLGRALVWRGMVWLDGHVKVNYQVSLLTLGVEKSKLRLNPDWAKLGN